MRGTKIQRRRTFTHLDAAESSNFLRDLETVKVRTYDKKYPELMARTLVPVDNEVQDDGSAVMIYRQFDRVGMAKIIASYADDLPRADVNGVEFPVRIKDLGSAYGYNVREAKASRKKGTMLEQRRANTAKRAIEELVDRIAAKGDAETGLTGLLNQANAQSYTVPAGVGGITFALKTADEILKDLNGITEKVVDTTNGVEIPDTIILPIKQNLRCASLRVGDTGETVLSHFLRTNPYIKTIIQWYSLKGAGAAGADRMVCYRRDPDALQLVMPQEFMQHPVQEKNLEFVVNCTAATGGVVAYYPMSICYGDGI